MEFELTTKQEAIHKLGLFLELIDQRDVKMFIRGTFTDQDGELAFLVGWREIEHIGDVHGFYALLREGAVYLKPRRGESYGFRLEAA